MQTEALRAHVAPDVGEKERLRLTDAHVAPALGEGGRSAKFLELSSEYISLGST